MTENNAINLLTRQHLGGSDIECQTHRTDMAHGGWPPRSNRPSLDQNARTQNRVKQIPTDKYVTKKIK